MINIQPLKVTRLQGLLLYNPLHIMFIVNSDQNQLIKNIFYSFCNSGFIGLRKLATVLKKGIWGPI